VNANAKMTQPLAHTRDMVVKTANYDRDVNFANAKVNFQLSCRKCQRMQNQYISSDEAVCIKSQTNNKYYRANSGCINQHMEEYLHVA
jgi:hypothetical protein